MKLNSLADLFKALKPETFTHKPALPAQQKTPGPERNKVVAIPTRHPINRQAGLMVSPVRGWIYQPLPPEKLPTRESKEIEELKAALKIERNDHARTRDELAKTRARLRQTIALSEKLDGLVHALVEKCQAHENTIRQLEDLRL